MAFAVTAFLVLDSTAPLVAPSAATSTLSTPAESTILAATLYPLVAQVLIAISAASSANAVSGPRAAGTRCGSAPGAGCCAEAMLEAAASASAPRMASDLVLII